MIYVGVAGVVIGAFSLVLAYLALQQTKSKALELERAKDVVEEMDKRLRDVEVLAARLDERTSK